jgi:DNA-directed RNA polymerase specialized sigma24 family protein
MIKESLSWIGRDLCEVVISYFEPAALIGRSIKNHMHECERPSRTDRYEQESPQDARDTPNLKKEEVPLEKSGQEEHAAAELDYSAVLLENWDDIYPRLMALANRTIRRSGSDPHRTTVGARDVIEHVIMEEVAGKRQWSGEGSLFQYLSRRIVREIQNRVRAEPRAERLSDSNVFLFPANLEAPKEAQREEELTKLLLDYLAARDPMLRRIAEIILMSGDASTMALAQVLNMSSRQVDQMKIRLRLEVKRYLEANARKLSSNEGMN